MFDVLTSVSTSAARDRAEDTLDELLTALHDTHPLWSRGVVTGLANHAPMAAEALVALGQPDAIRPLVNDYAKQLSPLGRGVPISADEQPTAIGRRSRMADWIATFERALDDDGVQTTLDRWWPRLWPGVMSLSMHGLIRLGHGMQSWSRRPDAPARQREIAHALGAWAAGHQPLPGEVGSLVNDETPERALREAMLSLRLMPSQLRRGGLICEAAAAVEDSPTFIDDIGLIDLRGDWEAHLVSLMELAAELMVVGGKASAFVYLHAVTAPQALASLSPWLSEPNKALALRSLVQAIAAAHVANGITAVPNKRLVLQNVTPAKLAHDAVATGNDHVIKLAAAVLRAPGGPSPLMLTGAAEFVAARS